MSVWKIFIILQGFRICRNTRGNCVQNRSQSLSYFVPQESHSQAGSAQMKKTWLLLFRAWLSPIVGVPLTEPTPIVPSGRSKGRGSPLLIYLSLSYLFIYAGTADSLYWIFNPSPPTQISSTLQVPLNKSAVKLKTQKVSPKTPRDFFWPLWCQFP